MIADDAMDSASPDFWHRSFRLCHDGSGSCPAFLADTAAGIVTAGKARMLLRSFRATPTLLVGFLERTPLSGQLNLICLKRALLVHEPTVGGLR